MSFRPDLSCIIFLTLILLVGEDLPIAGLPSTFNLTMMSFINYNASQDAGEIFSNSTL